MKEFSVSINLRVRAPSCEEALKRAVRYTTDPAYASLQGRIERFNKEPPEVRVEDVEMQEVPG